MRRSKLLTFLVQRVPGKRTFGIYRFLPLGFLAGAGIEWSMINWKPNGVNFYTTYKQRRIEEEALRQIEREDLKERVLAELQGKKPL